MLTPVSPNPPALTSPGSDGGHGAQPALEEEDIDFSQAMLDDPIVGVEQIISDKHGPGPASQNLSLPRRL